MDTKTSFENEAKADNSEMERLLKGINVIGIKKFSLIQRIKIQFICLLVNIIIYKCSNVWRGDL